VTQTIDPVTDAINRLPGVIQEDVQRLLALHAGALARAHEPEIFNDDEAVVAAQAVVNAYNAALRSISTAFGEPELVMDRDVDDEAECFEGSLNTDGGDPAPAFPPFLRSQLDRGADARKEKNGR
jgi:hypothetical protein